MCVALVVMSGHWVLCSNKKAVLLVNTATTCSVHRVGDGVSNALFVGHRCAHDQHVTSIWTIAIIADWSTAVIVNPTSNRALFVTGLCAPPARPEVITVTHVLPSDAQSTVGDVHFKPTATVPSCLPIITPNKR
jgi:hypothetical protein